MESIKEIFRIGKGPSSSHTMGPQRAAQIFLKRHPNAHRFEVTLYGSLAATGKGHMTDVAIQELLRAREDRVETDGVSAVPPQRYEVCRPQRLRQAHRGVDGL